MAPDDQQIPADPRLSEPGPALDQLGVIPAPDESADDQQKRYESLLRLEARLSETLGKGEPLEIGPVAFRAEDRIPEETMQSCLTPAAERYDFALPWVPGFFSDQGLGHFFGGMAMDLVDEKEAPDTPFYLFQLRKAFQNTGKWLIYSREELVAHEGCHIARMGLQAETYEEMLAYRISESAFRRYAGPIFSNPRRVPLFMLATALFLVSQLAGIFFGAGLLAIWLLRAPLLLLLLYWLIANQRCHNRFNQAGQNLEALSPGKSEPILFRLSDDEIHALGEGVLEPEATRELLMQASPLRQRMFERYLV